MTTGQEAIRTPDDGEEDELEALLNQYDLEAQKQTQRVLARQKRPSGRPKGMAAAREEGLAQALPEDNKGYQLLKKMGFREGQAIGLSMPGRTEPIPLDIKGSRAGLGIDEGKKRRRAEEQQRALEEQAAWAKRQNAAAADWASTQRSQHAERKAMGQLRAGWRALQHLEEQQPAGHGHNHDGEGGEAGGPDAVAAATPATGPGPSPAATVAPGCEAAGIAPGGATPTADALPDTVEGLLLLLPALARMLEADRRREARGRGAGAGTAGAGSSEPGGGSEGMLGDDDTHDNIDDGFGVERGGGRGALPASSRGGGRGEDSGYEDDMDMVGGGCCGAPFPGPMAGGRPAATAPLGAAVRSCRDAGAGHDVVVEDENVGGGGSGRVGGGGRGCAGDEVGGGVDAAAQQQERLEPGLQDQLLVLQRFLRERHLYCLYCGCRYGSREELAAGCPGLAEDDH